MNKTNNDIEQLQAEIKELKKQLGMGMFKLSDEGREYFTDQNTCNFTVRIDNFSILDFANTIVCLCNGETIEGKYHENKEYVVFSNDVYIPVDYLEEV